MIEFNNGNEYVRFYSKGYQFPDKGDDPYGYDANWLMVSYQFNVRGRKWEVDDPSFLTYELAELGMWFRNIWNESVITDDLGFIEPNLYFQLINKTSDSVKLRIRLVAELRYSKDEEVEYLECTMDKQMIAEVVTCIEQELEKYPQRGEAF